MDARAQAINLLDRGEVREAELICERRLIVDPDDADSCALLAEIHLSTGRDASAADMLTRLTQLRPQDASVHRRLAGVLLSQGCTDQAINVLRTAIAIEPRSTRAHNNLGQALMRLGRTEEAKASFQEALRLDPRYAVGYNNLGMACTEGAEFERAMECFRRALELDPALAIAQLNLAIACERAGRLAEALQGYEAVLARAPEFADAWVGRGSALSQQRRFEDALESLERALSLRPGDAATLTRKARVLMSMERVNESLSTADEALRRDAANAEAHHVRGEALRKLGRKSEALQSLEFALRLNPNDVQGWGNLGVVQHELGEFDLAVRSFRRALELDPANIEARTRLLARLIPSVPLTQEEAMGARGRFDTQLLEFEGWSSTRVFSESEALTVAQQQFFYLSYEEESNRSLLERYRGACAARLASFDRDRSPGRERSSGHECASVPPGLSGGPAQRFKLGLVSAHVHDHSVYNAIVRGWLKHLDRARFDIALFSLGAKQDASTREARASVEHFEAGSRPTGDWAAELRRRRFDALIFPEIGMNETALALASQRLAPRQFAAWGHPETSGLPTIDGYLSAELFEPRDAQDHYTEPLVRLPNLGVHCRPYGTVATPVDFDRLGIDRNDILFICPGVPFKYRPKDDRILVDIARRLTGCVFVFFESEVAELSHKLHARIAAEFRNAQLDPARYLVSIPWQPRAAFFGLLRQADVYLDTIGFSGFNTLMQAVECHLPCVTYEGRFMRGRLGSGILRRLGLPELVALDKDQYVDLAVKLASSDACRSEIREKIRRAEATAYSDIGAVDALSAVLLEST
jgi:protein O-GlcNAc transferase